MEGKFRFYFANPRVRIQESAEGAFVRSTLIGPLADMDEAIGKYFIAYPIEAYDTILTYEGIVSNNKDKKEKVVTFRRYHTSD